jgi:hypothetical protein
VDENLIKMAEMIAVARTPSSASQELETNLAAIGSCGSIRLFYIHTFYELRAKFFFSDDHINIM